MERAYSVTLVRQSVSVRVRDDVSNLRLSFSGISNLRLSVLGVNNLRLSFFFQAGTFVSLDTFTVVLLASKGQNRFSYKTSDTYTTKHCDAKNVYANEY